MQQPSTDGQWRAIVQSVAPYRLVLAQGVILLVLTNALDKAIPWMVKGAVDSLASGRFEGAQSFALGVVGLGVVMGVVRVFSRTRVFNTARDVEFDLRNRLLAKLQELGPSFFRDMSTGETMSRAINDLSQVRAMIGFGLLNLVNSTLAYGMALAFMLGMSVELTLWALLPYPLLILLARWLGRATYLRSRDAQEALGALSSQVQETLSGVRIVRAFTAELEQAAHFDRANERALDRNMRLVVLRGVMWPMLMGIGSAGTLLVLWRGSAMMARDAITPGELVAFIAYAEGLKWPTLGLGYILAVVQRGRASYARIQHIFDATPEVVQAPDAVEPKGPGHLGVDHLSYRYGDREVLSDITLDVPAGSSLAIVGRTGSGKSTLAALLPRLLDTPPNAVHLDGVDVTRLALQPLRRQVGFAQQEPFLFSTSITRNVGYRYDDPSAKENLERIREATREACVLDEIEELPAGFDTVVGERGVQLSGGQKQRIALARSLLNEPSVLVMDDPLSAVDARTEAKIMEALERAGRGRTLILITNRIAAAARCDAVAVLDGGRLVERGTHESLVEAGGLYAELAARQRLGQELSDL